MSKKYRVYRDGGSPFKSNPTAMWFAQMGGTQEEMPMMQEQQQGEDPMAILFQQVAQALEQGADPAELVASLMQNQVPAEAVMQIFVQVGMPQESVQQLVASVMQEMQQSEAAQQTAPPSDEEAMAMMQQEEAAQQAIPMGKHGYVQKKLKQAKKGMQQMSGSDTNLAAYDNVSKNNLLEFNKDNELKLKFEQEYDDLNNYIDNPMPEARYGRGMERREARRERRQERRDARRARRDSRDINEAMQDAYGKIAFPPGVSPMMMPGSPVVGGSGVMDLEIHRGGLFNRIKDMKMHIEGMGMPANFSQGMFMNGMYNPWAFQNQGNITQKITYPGEITDNVNTPTEKVIKNNNNNNVPNNNDVNNGGTASPTMDELNADFERMKRENEERLKQIKGDKEDLIVDIEAAGSAKDLGLEETGIVNPDLDDVQSDDDLPYWVLAGTVGGGAGLNKLRNYFRTKGFSDFRMVTPEDLRKVPKNLQGTSQRLLNAADPQKMTKVAGTGTKAITGTGQKLIGKGVIPKPNFSGSNISGLSSEYKEAFRKISKSGTRAEMMALAKTLGVDKLKGWSPKLNKKGIATFIKSAFKFALEDGGTVNTMDQNYGDPNLYKFTGGGDYDYFEDGGYPQGMDVNDPYMPYMSNGGNLRSYQGDVDGSTVINEPKRQARIREDNLREAPFVPIPVDYDEFNRKEFGWSEERPPDYADFRGPKSAVELGYRPHLNTPKTEAEAKFDDATSLTSFYNKYYPTPRISPDQQRQLENEREMQYGGTTPTYYIRTLMSYPPKFEVMSGSGRSHGIFETIEQAKEKIVALGGKLVESGNSGSFGRLENLPSTGIGAPPIKLMNGGYKEGDEVYMNEAEIAQFMAAGGSVEYM